MKTFAAVIVITVAFLTEVSKAQSISNPSFESDFDSWERVNSSNEETTISKNFKNGEASAAIMQSGGRFEQNIQVYPLSDYELRAFVRGAGLIGVTLGSKTITAGSDGQTEAWAPISLKFNSGVANRALVFGAHNGAIGYFDDFQIQAISGKALKVASEEAKGQENFETIPGTCKNMSQLRIVSAHDDGTYQEGHQPGQAIDLNFDPASRWSSESIGKQLIVDLGSAQIVKEVGIAWYEGHERRAHFEIETALDGINYDGVTGRRSSGGQTTAIERYDFDDVKARYIMITGFGNEKNDWNSIVEVQAYGCGSGEIAWTGDGSAGAMTAEDSVFGLKRFSAPSENFDLTDWKLTVPVDRDHDGSLDQISEAKLARGWIDPDFFFTDPATGGMVFRSIPADAPSSRNLKYSTSELSEMLRAGNTSIKSRSSDGTPTKNNWVFSSAPDSAKRKAGGVDGTLKATLAVNEVTRIGDRRNVGKVVIGQIRARNTDPVRLYYRKLPENKFGSIYYSHTPVGDKDVHIEMIGSSRHFSQNPDDGIALDEVFSYEIWVQSELVNDVVHPMLKVKIIRDDGREIVAPPLDMINSGYSTATDFMHFKVGAYSKNSSSNWTERDFDQVTFFNLENSHDAWR